MKPPNDPMTKFQSELVRTVKRLADAITPNTIGTDAGGGHVESLTEAVMGVTKGLFAIAAAIDGLASATGGLAQAVEDNLENSEDD